jgi:hypothetical protein
MEKRETMPEENRREVFMSRVGERQTAESPPGTQAASDAFRLARGAWRPNIEVMPMKVPDRDEWFPISDDLPRPDWLAILEWLDNIVVANDRNAAVEQITAHWLRRLAQALGDGHVLHETEHYFCITTRDASTLKATVEVLDKAREYVLHTLGKAAGIRHVRKLIIMRLSSEDAVCTVWESVQTNSPLASRFFTPGMWPRLFCAMRKTSDEHRHLVGGVIEHLLSYLSLPCWLLSALGQSLRADLLGGRFAVLDETTYALHERCWNAQTIQEFWSGKTFYDSEWLGLSSNLAAVLLDIIRRELHPDYAKVQRFIQTASYDDGGEAAAQRFFGISLGEIAGVFLGEDIDWTPRPTAWHRGEVD